MPQYILGLSAFYHDSAAALICDGKLVAAAQEGRFIGKNMIWHFLSRRFNTVLRTQAPPREPKAELTQREMDIARSIQVVTEELVLRLARTVHIETGQKNLCLAGGVALNRVSNGRLLREGPFESIWIQPASGDAGGAVGAALSAYHEYLEKPRQVASGDSMQSS